MEIKVLWGFEGDPEKLKTDNGRVLAGTVLDIDEELAHALIGKGLAAEVGANAKPKAAKPKDSKPALSEETKPAASEESKPAATEETK